MIYCDYHIHTNYSPDSDSDMDAMIRGGISLGLKEIALTDHVDYDTHTPPIDFDRYISYFNNFRDKYSNHLNLVLGVEIGLGAGVHGLAAELSAKYPFDFIIGSSHAVNGSDLYYDNFCMGKDKKTAYTAYFADMLENIKNTDAFCVYGHLDFISRYGAYDDNSLVYEEYADVIDEVLKALIHKGKGIEINTSGFRYGINQAYPQINILKRYKSLGGEIVTVGSDAHSPENIAGRFDAAYAMLNEAGFKHITLYRELKPVFKRI